MSRLVMYNLIVFVDRTWTFKDMCYASSFPPVDDSGIFEGVSLLELITS